MPNPSQKPQVIVNKVDFAHSRLADLIKIAELAYPFYQWVEKQFQTTAGNTRTLDENLRRLAKPNIVKAITACYDASGSKVPKLYDGAAREYGHRKACFYFFGWLVRDAPLQRLSGLVRAAVNGERNRARAIEIDALASLIVAYRDALESFSWEAVREVFIDRLEGSRRSLKGHEKEVVARGALTAAVQRFFAANGGYGIYTDATVLDGEVKIGNETFDASLKLIAANKEQNRQVLVPVKTRETSGGGHAHLFTRDINSAISTAKQAGNYYVISLIVAQSWSQRELKHVEDISDLALSVQSSPNDFDMLPDDLQKQLDDFVASLLRGEVEPKTWDQIQQLVRGDEP